MVSNMHEIIKPLFKEIDNELKKLYNQRKIDEGLLSIRNNIISNARNEMYRLCEREILKMKRIEMTQIKGSKNE